MNVRIASGCNCGLALVDASRYQPGQLGIDLLVHRSQLSFGNGGQFTVGASGKAEIAD